MAEKEIMVNVKVFDDPDYCRLETGECRYLHKDTCSLFVDDNYFRKSLKTGKHYSSLKCEKCKEALAKTAKLALGISDA